MVAVSHDAQPKGGNTDPGTSYHWVHITSTLSRFPPKDGPAPSERIACSALPPTPATEYRRPAPCFVATPTTLRLRPHAP
eukprot:scaffold20434_cov101-Isochrysis_galbana.AAC.1